MGTRSLTVFKEEDGKEICVMYRQYDGYPQGHGRELANFLSGMKMVNGISSADKGKIANGMSCLTAQVIRELKGKDVGGIYIHPLGTRGMWEDYIYIISGKTGEEPEIQILEACGSEKRRKEKELFSGPATEVKKWIEQLKH